MEFYYQLDNEVVCVQAEPQGEGSQITIGDHTYHVQLDQLRADEVSFVLNGQRHTAQVANTGATRYVAIAGEVFELKKADTTQRTRRAQQRGEDNLTASMPGQITKVMIQAGDRVQRGQPMLVLEAMKMEIRITASHDGRVAKVLIEQGQVVERGQALIEMNSDN